MDISSKNETALEHDILVSEWDEDGELLKTSVCKQTREQPAAADTRMHKVPSPIVIQNQIPS